MSQNSNKATDLQSVAGPNGLKTGGHTSGILAAIQDYHHSQGRSGRRGRGKIRRSVGRAVRAGLRRSDTWYPAGPLPPRGFRPNLYIYVSMLIFLCRMFQRSIVNVEH
jgi:hypothetical protein